MREKAIVTMIRKRLAEIPDSYVLTLHQGGYGRRGVPDILWVYCGRAVFIEAKTQTGRLTKLQEAEIRRIRTSKAVCEIVRGKEELENLIGMVTHGRH